MSKMVQARNRSVHAIAEAGFKVEFVAKLHALACRLHQLYPGSLADKRADTYRAIALTRLRSLGLRINKVSDSVYVFGGVDSEALAELARDVVHLSSSIEQICHEAFTDIVAPHTGWNRPQDSSDPCCSELQRVQVGEAFCWVGAKHVVPMVSAATPAKVAALQHTFEVVVVDGVTYQRVGNQWCGKTADGSVVRARTLGRAARAARKAQR